MKNSVKVAGVAAVIILLLYLKKKKPALATTLESTKVSDSSNEPIASQPILESNEPTQVFGAMLPDGTTATGNSNIAPNPLDVVPLNKPITQQPKVVVKPEPIEIPDPTYVSTPTITYSGGGGGGFIDSSIKGIASTSGGMEKPKYVQ